MIHNILPVISSELNEYLKSRYNSLDDRVILSNAMDQEGRLAINEMNRMVCSLINIKEDRTLKATKGMRASEGMYYQGGGDIQITLELAFIALFKNSLYAEALKYLSGTIYFFQEKSVFTNANTPALTSNIDRLSFEMKTMNIEELQSVVSLLGIRHVPMVVYSVRLLTFSSDNIEDTVPSLSGISVDPESA